MPSSECKRYNKYKSFIVVSMGWDHTGKNVDFIFHVKLETQSYLHTSFKTWKFSLMDSCFWPTLDMHAQTLPFENVMIWYWPTLLYRRSGVPRVLAVTPSHISDEMYLIKHGSSGFTQTKWSQSSKQDVNVANSKNSIPNRNRIIHTKYNTYL